MLIPISNRESLGGGLWNWGLFLGEGGEGCKIGVKKFTREVRQVLCRNSSSSLQKFGKFSGEVGKTDASVWQSSRVCGEGVC